MDKSEDLSKNDWNVWNIQNIERNKKQIEDEVTDHKYHSHIQMGNFPLATKT